MGEMIKPAVALLAVTLIAAFLLGVVFNVTEEPIARQKAKTEAESVAKLLPATDSTDSEPVSLPDSVVTKSITCYDTGGQVVGYAITVSPKGYAGAIDMMVGFDTDGVIQGISILSHEETPGLGANAKTPAFTNMFIGKSGELSVTKVKNSGSPQQIEAIASATITTDAVVKGVNAASAYFEAYLNR